MVTKTETFEIKPNYKKTDIGIIPDDWEVKKIRKFTNATSGGTPSTFISEYWNGDIRWMNSGEVHLKKVYEVEGRITESGLKNSSTKLIPKKCVLIGLAGQGKTRGTVAINHVELCVNQSIGAILPNKSFIPEYLYYNLDSRYNELRILSSGEGGRGGLNLTIIRNIQIPLPPTVEEQSAIAQVLSDIDELIIQLDKLIEKKNNIKQGTIQELLIEKRRLPGFNEEWEVKKFTEIFKNIPTKNFQIKTSKYQDFGSYPVIDQGKQKIVGYSDLTEKVFSCPEKGVIIFGDHTREIKFVDFNFVIGADGTQILITLSNNSPKFFYYQLKTKNIPETGYNRHYKFLKEMLLMRPKPEEQTAIDKVLSDMDAEINELEKKRDKYLMIKKGIMQKLLTGEIRLK